MTKHHNLVNESFLLLPENTERRSDDMRDMDAATKQYMSHKDVVADVFNFYLYGGEQ